MSCQYEELIRIGPTTHGLPKIHRIPFDRMLVAQAIVEGITLLTDDTILREISVPGAIGLTAPGLGSMG